MFKGSFVTVHTREYDIKVVCGSEDACPSVATACSEVAASSLVGSETVETGDPHRNHWEGLIPVCERENYSELPLV